MDSSNQIVTDQSRLPKTPGETSRTGEYWQFHKSLAEICDYMFTHKVACNVTFLVQYCGGDVHEFSAHKFILTGRSPVFEAMFSGPFNTDTVEVKDCDPVAFETMLRYMYTDKVTLTPDHVMALVYTAKKYMLPALVERCKTYLASCIDAENVCLITEQSIHFDLCDLTDMCLEYVITNTDQVFRTEGFKRLSFECLNRIVGDDRLKVSELTIFRACIQWASMQCRIRGLDPSPVNLRESLAEMVYLVRFPTMHLQSFTKEVSTTDILTPGEMVPIFQYLVCRMPKDELKFPTRVRAGNLNVCQISEKDNRGVCIGNDIQLKVDKDIRVHSVLHTVGKDIKNAQIIIEHGDRIVTLNPGQNEAVLSEPFDIKANIPYFLRYKLLGGGNHNAWTKELLAASTSCGVRFRNASGSSHSTVFTAVRFQVLD